MWFFRLHLSRHGPSARPRLSDRGAVLVSRLDGQLHVSIFLTDARSKTLPIKMLQYIEESPDPSIAALSTLILIATLALLFIADRALGLHRLAGLAE
jgi:ABC-type spermidine/putrescine transport system permease subunit II